MEFNNILIEKEEKIGIITLNRPPANPINYAILDELEKALTELEKEEETRALIITGAGDKGFSAGLDLNIAGAPEQDKVGPKGHEVLKKIERYPKPTIAAINGYALGGGCELAMACCFRIMVDSPSAVIGLPEIDLGIIPGMGGTQRLPRLVGKTRALEMLLFGKRISPHEALRIGLITKISQEGELMNDSKDFAAMLTKKAPVAVKIILDVVNRGLNTTLEEGLKIELQGIREVKKSKDAIEGMASFKQKREPVITG
jgi:enoyl-CoA hydratase/carnithine racemase